MGVYRAICYKKYGESLNILKYAYVQQIQSQDTELYKAVT